MDKKQKRIKRKIRIKGKVKGTIDRPRLSVFRSNKHIYAQIINDDRGQTICGVSEKELSDKKSLKNLEKSKELGLAIAKKALAKKIIKVAFDRSGYAYHGRIKAVADGAREGGLKF